MRVSVTQRRDLSAADLRSAGEAAPSLAFPWVAKLRYGLLAGECALILAAHYIFGVELPILWLALPVAVAALGNPLLERFTGAFRDRRALGILLTLDTLCLTALLSLTGGPANPFTLLYLVQITLSAVILSKEWTWVIGGLSVAGYAFLFPVHVRVPVFESHHTSEGFSVHLAGMWIAFAAASLVITIFIGKVSEALRRREQEALLLRDQAARDERLAAIVTLAAGAAHELGTPLGTIAVVSKDLELYAERELGNGEVATEARLIRSEVDRCRGILQQMSIRGAEPLGETPVPLGLSEALGSVKQGFISPERELVRTEVAGEGQEVTLPPDATRQALTALVRNALDASDGSHPVLLTAECAQGKLRFTVEDSGCGMRRETLDRVAQPFFTTKPPGRGMGLGTFLVRAYAEALNGSLEFESEAGAGTKVTLELPLPRP
ncbi:MAG TPA: ATP-binding protein [Bryobacteraceae bacterium]|nr:ATP-binding protein [Bryobacteraceae bacterium]